MILADPDIRKENNSTRNCAAESSLKKRLCEQIGIRKHSTMLSSILMPFLSEIIITYTHANILFYSVSTNFYDSLEVKQTYIF